MNKKGKLTIVWGGQFGSEGKGQICAHIQTTDRHAFGVRVGGPNAGHTFFATPIDGGPPQKVVVQSIPVAAMLGAQGVIGPAGLFIPELLVQELVSGMNLLGTPVLLDIDSCAAVIEPRHMKKEDGLKIRIGSTGEGVGAATADKVMRNRVTVGDSLHTVLAPFLPPMAEDAPDVPDLISVSGARRQPRTQDKLNAALLSGAKVMIEGTQGYGLSLHTSGFYPFCTSRECTPQALLAETGIGPHNADEVESVMVIRTFPIRVGGNSGPLDNEISWETLKDRTGGYVKEPERTTVTKKIRRIAEIDYGLLRRAVQQCGPTHLAITFLDYVFPQIAECSSPLDFPGHVWSWLGDLQAKLRVPIKYVSWGPGRTSTIPTED